MTTIKIRLTQERKEYITHEIELTPEQYKDYKGKMENALTEKAMADVNEEILARMHNGEFPNSVWDCYGDDWEPTASYYDGMYGEWHDA